MSQGQSCAKFDLGTGDWHFSLPLQSNTIFCNIEVFILAFNLSHTLIFYLDYFKLFQKLFSPAGHFGHAGQYLVTLI